MIRLMLGGGGDREDSRLLDEAFAEWVGAEGHLLYLPIALRGIIPFASCEVWFRQIFEPLGLTRIAMWTELEHKTAADLAAFDAIYIGGGNTFGLLAELRATGFEQVLCDFAQAGQPIYGGSAGAALLGRTIETIAHIDENWVGLIDLTGLDLVNGHAVWVHYAAADDQQIWNFVEREQTPVIAIAERGGVIVEGDKLTTVGFEAAFRFDRSGNRTAIPSRPSFCGERVYELRTN